MTDDLRRLATDWATGPVRLRNPWITPEDVLRLLDEIERLTKELRRFSPYKPWPDPLQAEVEKLIAERDAYRADAIQWAKGEHLATGRGLHSDEDAGVWVDRNVRESLGFALEDKP